MANSIYKVHEMVNKVGFEFDDDTAKKVTALAEKAGKLAADNMTQELSSVVSEIGDIFNQALVKLGKQQIDLTDMIKMPNSATIGKLTSSFVSQISSSINNGITSGINDGLAKAGDIVKQLNDLRKRRNELDAETKRLDKRNRKYDYLAGVLSMDVDEFRPLKLESDIDEQAQRIMGAFIDAEEALDMLTRGTKEYDAALVKALDAASNLYSMSQTIKQNKSLVKDKSLIEDFSPDNLDDLTYDLSQKSKVDFEKFQGKFDRFYRKKLTELEQITVEIQRLEQSSVEIIDQERAQSALKTLNEIEEVYKRIKKPARNNILKSLEYEPTGHGKTLNALSARYQQSFDSDESWELQYQWLVKFVREYEAYAAKIEATTDNKKRSEMSHNLESYTELYKSLKPMAANAENMLRNILNMADNIPLVGMGGAELEKNTDAIAKAREEAEAKAKADEASAEAATRERQERDAIAKEKEKDSSYTPGSIMDNSMFANMFGKSAKEAEQKQGANEDSAKAVQEELDASTKITSELEKQQKLLLYRRGSTDFNNPYPNWSNQDSMWNIVDSLQWGYGGYGDGLYASVRSAAENLVPLNADLDLNEDKFFEFDASGYNMLVVNTAEQAQKLETYLTKLQKFILASGDFRGFDDDIKGVTDETLFSEAATVFESFDMSREEFAKWIMQMKQLVALGGLDESGKFATAPDNFLTSRNFASRFMQNMGYEGVLMNTDDVDWDGNNKGSMLFNPDEDQIRASMKVFDTGADLLKYLEASAQSAEQAVDSLNESLKETEQLNKTKVKKGQTYSGTLYHGSKSPMDNVTYDPSKGKGMKNLGSGLYFTPDLELAAKHGKNIVKQNVQLENIFTLTEDFITDIDDLYQAMGKVKPVDVDWKTITNDLMSAIKTPGQAQEFAKKMLDMGYRGMYSKGYGYADPNVEQIAVYDEAYQQNLTTQRYDDIVNGAKAAEQAVDNLNESIKENNQLKQETHSDGTGAGDASSEDVKAAQLEAENLRTELENANERARVAEDNAQNERDMRIATENALSEEIGEKWSADARAKEAEAEAEKLRQELTSKTTTIGSSKDDAVKTDIEETRMKGLKEAVEAVTTAVGLKTQAFKDEAIAVNTAVESEIQKLDELEQKVLTIKTTLEGLLSNIKTGQDDVGTGLSNIVVNVKHPNTQQNDWSQIAEVISKVNIQPTPVKDVGNVLATEKTLTAIKTAVEAINSKAQKGIRVKLASDASKSDKEQVGSENKSIVKRADSSLTTRLENVGATHGNIDLKLTERIKTALTSLLKYKTTLQEANQLSGDLEVGIENLANELSQVSDKEGLATWSEHFKQFKNASSIIQTLIKDYQALGAMQAKANAETDPTKLEQYLDDIQILQDRIDIKTVDVNVNDNRFEEARQRAYNIASHELQQKEELVDANQVEAEIIKRLIKLYEQLGRARATGNMMEVTRIRRLIAPERAQLASVDYATDMKFKAAKEKGFNAQRLKDENAKLKEQEGIVKRLAAMYQEYGALSERANGLVGTNQSNELKSQAEAKLEEIRQLKKSITKITPEIQESFDEAFNKGRDAASNKQYEAMAKSMDAEESKYLKELVKDYEKLGQLQARADLADGEHEKEYLKELVKIQKENIQLKQQGLGIDQALYDTKYLEAYEKELDALNIKIAKQKDRDEKRDFRQEVRNSQRDAKLNGANSAINRGESTLMSAMPIDSLSADKIALLEKYNEELQRLKTMHRDIKNSDGIVSEEEQRELIGQTNAVNTLTKEINELVSEYQRLSGDNVSVIGQNSLNSSAGLTAYKQQLSDAVMAATNGKAQIKSFDAETKTLVYTVKTGAHEFTTYTAAVRSADGALVSMQGTTKKAETFLEATKRKLKEISSYISGMALLRRLGQELKRGVTYIREIDSALTELKKVTDSTEESYDKFLQTAAKIGATIGSTISDVTEATATFAKLGYSMKTATEMAEAALVYKNVGDNISSAEDAADSIISTLKGFGLEASEAMRIVDRFNEVGNRFAITSQGLGEALRLSASALNEGGNTLDESIGLITAANEVVNDPSSVGTALKTLTLRLRGSKTELEEMGEDVSDMATTTSQLQAKLLALTGGQVDIMLDENTFKSSAQILREMAEAWESMTDIERASALELMGGKRQANVLSALIQNFDTAEAAIEASANSAGSALRENEKYLDSIQGRIDLFNNSVQAMWQNTLDSDVVKFFVDFGTNLIGFVDKIGLVRTAFGGLFIYLTAIKKNNPITIIKDWASSMVNAGAKATQQTMALKRLTVQQQAAKMATAGLTQEQIKENLIKNNNISTDRAQLLAKEAVTAAKIKQAGVTAANILQDWTENKLTLSNTALDWLEKQSTDAVTQAKLAEAVASGVVTKQDGLEIASTYGLLTAKQALNLGIKGLMTTIKTSMLSNPVGWIMMAVSAVVMLIQWISSLKSKTEKLSEELQDLKTNIADIKSEFDSLNSELETTQERMAELLAMDRLSFTEKEELENLKKQNAELQREIDLNKTLQATKQKELEQTFKETMDSKLTQDYMKDNKNGLAGTYTKKASGWNKFWGASTMSGKEALKTNIDVYQEKLDYNKRLQAEAIEAQKVLDNDESSWFDRFIAKQTIDIYDENSGLLREFETSIADNLEEYRKDIEGIEYGDDPEVNAYLDYVNNMLDRWAIKSNGDNAQTNAIARIFNKKEFETVSDEIDDLVKQLEKDPTNQTLIDDISAKCQAAAADLDAVGLSVDDAKKYFTSFASEASFNTLEKKTDELKRASSTFEDLLRGAKFNIDVDGQSVDTGLEELFDKEGKVVQTKLSQIFNNTSEQTRKDITAILEGSYDQIKDGLNDAEITNLLTNAGIRFSRAILEIEKSDLANTNLELFPGLKDEISGIIDTFDELTSAIGSVVDAMDTLDQARAEEAYSGSVSLETLEKLMQSTENYADLIEVDETGAIKLAANAQDILVKQKLEAIKTNADLALKDAELALQEAIHAEQTYTQTGPAQDFLRKMTMEVGGAIAFVSSLWNDMIAGNWSGAWERAKTAQQASLSNSESEYAAEAAEASALVAEAKKRVEDAEKMKKIADGLTQDNVKKRYDSDTASGGNSTQEDAEKDLVEEGWETLVNKYENELALITNERDLIEAEIDKIEARGGKASAQYYQDLIDNSNEEKDLLQEKYDALKSYLDYSENAIDPDTWTDYNNELNEIAVAIKECETNTIEWAEAIREIDIHYFERTTEAISQLGEELDFVNSLLEDEEVADENGNWSSAALTRIGLYTQQMEKDAAEAKLYQDEIDKLNTQYENGELGEEQYQERLSKLVSSQRDAINSYEDAKDSIVELNKARVDAIKDGIEKEIEAYEDLIDLKKEELDAERDLYDFKKNINKQTKDITSLERRIAALSGSTNASDIATRRKLEAELLEAKENLNDTYYEHSRDQQSQALDEEAEAFSESREKYIEELEAMLDNVETLITNSIMDVLLNADKVYGELNGIADTYGITLSGELTQPWKDASAQAIAWKNELQNSMTSGEYAALIGEGGAITAFANGIATKLEGSWDSAQEAASGYFDFLTKEELGINFSETIAGFGDQIQKLVTYWDEVKAAAEAAHAEQEREVTVGGTPNVGGEDKEKDETPVYNPDDGVSMSSLDIKNLQEVLNTVFEEKLSVDGKYGPATTAAVKRAQKTIGASQDGYYGPDTKAKMADYIRYRWQDGNGGSSAIGQAIAKMINKLPTSYYAKGTMGTSRDGWAITDEIGDELVLVPGANGNLSFMRKGTSVVPADITANLVEWGKLNPDMFNIANPTAGINMISNAVNKPEFNLSFEALVKADRIDQDTLPEVKKFVQQEINSLVKQMNYALKGVGGR